MTVRALSKLARESVSAWVDDYAPSMGAALAYYTMFSLAPLLVIVVAVAGLVFGPEAAQGALVAQLRGLLGDATATSVQDLLKGASQESQGIIATVVGGITLVLGATSVFGELQSDLDRIWRAPAAPSMGFRGILRSRVLSFGMVLAIGFLLLVSLVITTALAAMGEWWGPLFGGWEILLQGINLVVSLVIVTVLFALIYKMLPRVRVAWRDVWIGAVVTSVLFTIGKFGIGLYLGKSDVTTGFGAAGSIAVLLVWVYYSAQIFLLGAEFTWVYAHREGSRAGDAEAVASPSPLRQPAHDVATKAAAASGAAVPGAHAAASYAVEEETPTDASTVAARGLATVGVAIGFIWLLVDGLRHRRDS